MQASRIAAGVQPRGKKLKPLMREYASLVTVRGPQQLLSQLPIKCTTDLQLPLQCSTTPHMPMLPAQAKRIRLPYQTGDKAESDQWETVYGIAWTHESFINRAAGRSHPGHFLDGVHPVLKNMFEDETLRSTSDRAIKRSEQMRRWIHRAQELRTQGVDGKEDSPAHARKNLANKNLQLFHEMVVASGSPDVGIASNISRGFDLMGSIPVGSIYPEKATHATLLPDQVRNMAGTARAAIWEATKKVVDPETTEEVYRITLEERDKGWLRGPFTLDQLPANAVMSRRFGVKQTSTMLMVVGFQKFVP